MDANRQTLQTDTNPIPTNREGANLGSNLKSGVLTPFTGATGLEPALYPRDPPTTRTVGALTLSQRPAAHTRWQNGLRITGEPNQRSAAFADGGRQTAPETP